MKFSLVNRLNYLLEAIYYDAFATKNIVLFEYDPTYPRVFMNDVGGIISSLENAIKAHLYATNNNKILVKFKLTNYNAEHVFFRIFFDAQNDIQSLDDRYITELQKIVKKNNYQIIMVDDAKIHINVAMQLNKTAKEHKIQLKNNYIKKSHAVIAYDDRDGFEILYKQLKHIGIEVKQKHDYANLKAHLSDAIYCPDIIFIQNSYLENQQEFAEILNLQKFRKFQIIVIYDKDEKTQNNIKIHTIALRQPYTYDILIAVLNLAYQNKLLNKF
ncbi:hypothetical protein LMG7974_00092 [Campylobacter majalis]|uniref:Response regulator n=1 Tax=Campylobacter majalis TaxID=2790656 RepID=A0ABM8Q1T7_9BACT|nr:hypothetical protein [Campylobacter majalis]CAD7286804.1 hypothetical protein LMG7974_00092 [Campylobacter majalis]